MKKTIVHLAILALSAAIIFSTIQCNQLQNQAVNLDVSIDPFEHLSQYNFFKGDMAALEPNDGVLPYDLNTPLFTDYAHKLRFVWMPDGSSAEYKDEGAFNFPVGAVLIKNFYYPHDFRDETKGRKIIETRLLVHREKGWDALAYIWNDEQTEATLEIAGGRQDISWIHFDGSKRDLNYVVPNKNQCKGCHESKGKFAPIGPKAKNLNRTYSYPGGEENQLVKWASAGYLTGIPEPESAPRVAQWNHPETGTLEERARAWLDINCAHCHNVDGPANTSGLFLNTEETNPTIIGFHKTPVAAGRGSGNLKYDIVPGQPDSSIIVYRMESTDPGIMMPELGRKMIHREGVDLVRAWIASLDTVPGH